MVAPTRVRLNLENVGIIPHRGEASVGGHPHTFLPGSSLRGGSDVNFSAGGGVRETVADAVLAEPARAERRVGALIDHEDASSMLSMAARVADVTRNNTRLFEEQWRGRRGNRRRDSILRDLRRTHVLREPGAQVTSGGVEMAALRANGDKVPNVPEWTSAQPLDQARPDVRHAYKFISSVVEYMNGRWDRNIVLQTIFPEGLQLSNQVVLILDMHPDMKNDKDGIGFPNASASLGKGGVLVITTGKPPTPGSEASRLLGSVILDDSTVIPHEVVHTFIETMASLLGVSIAYMGDSGAYVHESTADAGNVGFQQFLLGIGARFLAGDVHFKIGDGWIKGAGFLRNMENPGQSDRGEAVQAILGEDSQKAHADDVDYHDPDTRAKLMRDEFGVHDLNSFGNRAYVLATLAFGGDAEIATHIREAAVALALSNGLTSGAYWEYALMEIVAGYLIMGEEGAQIELASWKKVLRTQFPKKFSNLSAMDIVRKLGGDKIRLKPTTRPT